MDTLVAGGANRRRSCRRSPKQGDNVICSRTGTAEDNLALALLDLSQHGLRLLLREPLSRGQGTEVTLGDSDGPEPLRLPATVVWCVDAPAGGYCVGLRLQRPLSAADLHSLTGDEATEEPIAAWRAGRL